MYNVRASITLHLEYSKTLVGICVWYAPYCYKVLHVV